MWCRRLGSFWAALSFKSGQICRLYTRHRLSRWREKRRNSIGSMVSRSVLLSSKNSQVAVAYQFATLFIPETERE